MANKIAEVVERQVGDMKKRDETVTASLIAYVKELKLKYRGEFRTEQIAMFQSVILDPRKWDDELST